MSVKISILIPCYNADRWIVQAIESALNQTYPDKEVIVVDDGSTDSSLEKIKSFGDSIRWETWQNQGGNATRNRLLELSTGEWLQYLDADDYLLPHKIEQQVDFLSQSPDVDVIFSPSIFEYDDPLGPRQEILPIPEPHDPWVLLARWYLPQTGSPIWRKQAIKEVGSWNVNQPCCQEHELYLRLLKGGKLFAYCDKTGSVYRQWSDSTVCRKNGTETNRRRLDIIGHAEQYLQMSGKLTDARQNAINQARFECARMIWLKDPEWAQHIIHQIKLTERNFVPVGSAAPASYRCTYQLFGFEIAESIAKFRRDLHHKIAKLRLTIP